MNQLPSIGICAVVLAVISSYRTLVDIKTPFLLPQLVSVSTATLVRPWSVLADLIAVTVIRRALIFVNATIASVVYKK